MSAADGRVARGMRTRTAVVDALVRMVGAGGLKVTGAQIAAEAGISERSLWTHFADLDAIHDAAALILHEQAMAHRFVIGEGRSLEERLRLFVAQRVRANEEIAPYARAARLREPFSVALRDSRSRFIAEVHREIREAFAPELDADPAAAREREDALLMATSWSAWSTLRDDLGLEPAAASAALAEVVIGVILRPRGELG